ncbi:MAG: PTS lactose/cellobiose transporter subunit IIA [Armatimonadota bacterium]
MTEINWEETAFQIILHGGNAKSLLHEALAKAREGKFQDAEKDLKQADEELKIAHEVQTKTLHKEAEGVSYTPNLLMVHAHGHLMASLTERTLIEELIELYKRVGAKV